MLTSWATWIAREATSYHFIDDEDVEMFYSKMSLAEDEQFIVADIEAVEEQVVDETMADALEVKEDEANEGASDEAKADTVEQVAKASEQVVGSDEHVAAAAKTRAEEVADQESSVKVL